MRFYFSSAFLATLLLGLLSCSRTNATRAADQMTIELKTNRPFPEIVLPSLSDGQPVSISKFRGQKLILQIFASW